MEGTLKGSHSQTKGGLVKGMLRGSHPQTKGGLVETCVFCQPKLCREEAERMKMHHMVLGPMHPLSLCWLPVGSPSSLSFSEYLKKTKWKDSI